MEDHSAGLSSTHSASIDEGGTHRSAEGTDYARLSVKDVSYLEQLKLDPMLGFLPVEQERERMRRGQTASVLDFPVRMHTFQTSACPVYIITPLNLPPAVPVTFYLHGGGWVLGDLATHTRLVCELALKSKAAIAFIDYPRAPEHRFPAALEACRTAVTEVLEHADSVGLDALRFGFAGDSSGGNLSAALILSMHQNNLPAPACQVLLYPAVDHSHATASYKEFEHNPNLSLITMKWFWENYLSDTAAGADPLASPLRAPAAALAAFPRTLLITCEYDVLRDEGERFAAHLIQAGVDVTAIRWLGALHGFLVTEPLIESSGAKLCIAMIARYLRDAYSIS
jgi:acetyl esterase